MAGAISVKDPCVEIRRKKHCHNASKAKRNEQQQMAGEAWSKLSEVIGTLIFCLFLKYGIEVWTRRMHRFGSE
eukprot:CAMPEP_0184408310 /NCGR_PEP_ID=MMETSP0738-20130409/3124_1 /TAXON_ID=385413 /ORGANISM="Thalassiosira miniscula, Strain CCMP1093" /LENGTH=72 /DNA_ID=CAMNT_0026765713 /DNA_START=44 /DNA_END=262 /DNA_ORIENTATION=-